MNKKMIIAPSVLNANNLALGEDIKKAIDSGIDRFHIDVMDGHFVPNLSYGPQLVEDLKHAFPKVEIEVHLMSDRLETLIPLFVSAGADLLEFHFEAGPQEQIGGWIDFLTKKNVKAGLVLNPQTPIVRIEPFLAQLDQVLLMTVNPGFGGQSFITASSARIAAMREMEARCAQEIDLEVDGGINAETAKVARQAGANVFVAGSFIFNHDDIRHQIKKLNQVIES